MGLRVSGEAFFYRSEKGPRREEALSGCQRGECRAFWSVVSRREAESEASWSLYRVYKIRSVDTTFIILLVNLIIPSHTSRLLHYRIPHTLPFASTVISFKRSGTRLVNIDKTYYSHLPPLPLPLPPHPSPLTPQSSPSTAPCPRSSASRASPSNKLSPCSSSSPPSSPWVSVSPFSAA